MASAKPAGGAGGGGAAEGPSGQALKRLAKEVTLTKGWEAKETVGCRYTYLEDMRTWTVFVRGPAKYTVKGALRDCPYAGYEFEAKVHIPAEYPHKCPEVSFAAGQVYGPSVGEDGEICPLRITGTWGPTKKMSDLALEIAKFLSEPEGAEPVNANADKALREDIKAFETTAKAWAAAKAKKL